MTTIQQRFDELGEQIAGLRSRVFDLTNRLAKIVEHPDTPELIRQYARGQIGSQPVAAIDGTGWAEAAFVDDVDPAQREAPPHNYYKMHGPHNYSKNALNQSIGWAAANFLNGGHVERGLAELRGQGE